MQGGPEERQEYRQARALYLEKGDIEVGPPQACALAQSAGSMDLCPCVCLCTFDACIYNWVVSVCVLLYVLLRLAGCRYIILFHVWG